MAQHVLRRALGTYRVSLLVILALLLSVSIAAGGIQSLLQQLSASCGVPSWISQLSPLTILLAVLYLLARRGPLQQRPVIHKHDHPAQTRALILFLSPAPERPHPVYDIGAIEFPAMARARSVKWTGFAISSRSCEMPILARPSSRSSTCTYLSTYDYRVRVYDITFDFA